MRTTESLLRHIIRETLLKEEVYGAQAVVYHGTRSNDPAKLFRSFSGDDPDNEFRPGKGAGATYGMGLYCVYDLKGTQTAWGRYGQTVLKMLVNLNQYIIFDADVAAKVYGRPLPPSEQALQCGLDRDIVKKLREIENKPFEVSSDIARPAADFLRGRCKGIVFTGRQDGKVVVIYDPSTVVPMGMTAASQDLADNPSSAAWTPVDADMVKSPIEKLVTGDFEMGKYERDDEQYSRKLLKKLRNTPPHRRVVKGNLFLARSGIESIPDGLHVKGDLDLDGNPLTSLPDGLRVDGSLNLSYCKQLTRLPEDLTVGGWLRVADTQITELPQSLRVLGTGITNGGITGFEGDKDTVPEHLKDMVY